jgi:large subunit ribosomal protein L21
MFAVVEISGRQYRVSEKDKVEVDLLEAEPGKNLKFDKVLLLAESEDSAKIGKPYLSGASVEAKVLEHFKGEKIRVFKFTPKKRHSKTQGHRQNYTRLEVTSIKG